MINLMNYQRDAIRGLDRIDKSWRSIFNLIGPTIVESIIFNLIKSQFQLNAHHSIAVETLETISFE